jgi:hypothetical protein
MLEPLMVTRKQNGFVLVVGNHRYQAALDIGMKTVPCVISDEKTEGRWATLAEIDENLVRRALTPTETACLRDLRKKVYEEAHPETKHGATPGKKEGRGGKSKNANLAPSFAEAAAKAGRSVRTIQREAKRGEAITRWGAGAAEKIIGTSLDKGTELDVLATLPAGERDDLINRAAGGENVTALRPAKPEPPTQQNNPIIEAWHGATPEERDDAIAVLCGGGPPPGCRALAPGTRR